MDQSPGRIPDARIIRFIRQHHIFTLATSWDNKPWCACCFYVYLAELNLFIFTSDTNTIHGSQMILNDYVSGNIALETRIIGKIKGIQFKGKAWILDENQLKFARKAYLMKFPIAALMDTQLWGLQPDHIKMTNNHFGIGKKLIWNRLIENGGSMGIY